MWILIKQDVVLPCCTRLVRKVTFRVVSFTDPVQRFLYIADALLPEIRAAMSLKFWYSFNMMMRLWLKVEVTYQIQAPKMTMTRILTLFF
jgi:hypothetical protein